MVQLQKEAGEVLDFLHEVSTDDGWLLAREADGITSHYKYVEGCSTLSLRVQVNSSFSVTLVKRLL